MSANYHVYANDSRGGPVDYSAPVATVSGTSWSSPPLAFPADTTFAVRAFDPATGLEESNVDMRARLVLDAGGDDVTGRPNPCSAVVAYPRGIGGLAVHWAYSPAGQGGAPLGFRVWASAGPIDFAAPPAAVVPYAGPLGSATLAGLLAPQGPPALASRPLASPPGVPAGSSWAVAVRAFNAAGDDGNASAAAVATPLASGPAAVDSLAGAAA